MLLSDKQIIEQVEKCGLIDPFVPSKVKSILSKGLDPAGYVISLQPIFLVFDPPEKYIIDSLQPDTEENYRRIEGDFVIVPSYGRVLGVAVERLSLPLDISAECWGKSSLARIGVIPHITPIEAGYTGNITIEVSNFNPCPVKLYANYGIAQVRFHRHERATTGYEGKYQFDKTIRLNK